MGYAGVDRVTSWFYFIFFPDFGLDLTYAMAAPTFIDKSLLSHNFPTVRIWAPQGPERTCCFSDITSLSPLTSTNSIFLFSIFHILLSLSQGLRIRQQDQTINPERHPERGDSPYIASRKCVTTILRRCSWPPPARYPASIFPNIHLTNLARDLRNVTYYTSTERLSIGFSLVCARYYVCEATTSYIPES